MAQFTGYPERDRLTHKYTESKYQDVSELMIIVCKNKKNKKTCINQHLKHSYKSTS